MVLIQFAAVRPRDLLVVREVPLVSTGAYQCAPEIQARGRATPEFVALVSRADEDLPDPADVKPQTESGPLHL